MWRNYVTVGVRALAKNRTYAFINIFGLALGLAACLMIMLYVRYESSYDDWMPGADRAYQFQNFIKPSAADGQDMKLQMTSFVSRKALVKDFPQIEKSVYVEHDRAIALDKGQSSYVEDTLLVDGNLFDILQVLFLAGNPKTALDLPNSAVLTKSEAERRFGSGSPLGRTITLLIRGKPTDYVVTGVVRDLPKNTHIKFNMVTRYDPNSFHADDPDHLTSWGDESGWAYVKLKPGADPKEIERQLPAWEKRNIPNDTSGQEVTNPGDYQDWHLANIRNVHLGEAQYASLTPGNDRRTIVTFSIVALLILGMAVVNFTNLATARASQRAREVALRKVLGATRRQLVVQFIGESVLLTAAGMLLGLAMVELLLPAFNRFLDAEIAISYLGRGGILLPAILLVLVVGAAGGLYPAVYLSRFQPARVLKANKSAADAEGSGRLRSVLVVAQFAVSIGLIVCTAVVYAQTVYARTVDPGYKKEGLIQVQNISAQLVPPILETLKREVGRVDGVKEVALGGIGVAPGNHSSSSVYLPGIPKGMDLGIYPVDADFFRTMGMKMLAGRNFSESVALDDASLPVPADTASQQALAQRGINVVVSESAARRLGFTPQQAVGKQVRSTLANASMPLVASTIVGVVSDARFRSVRDPLQPIVYFSAKNRYNVMLVRYSGARPKDVMAKVEAIWKRMVPDVPFKADFAEDRVSKLYNKDEARAQLFGGFALLAVIVGCLGLFGLAAFTAERRTKEIGIRKILGARTRDIVRLLVWQFSKPVIVANVIAWPVAWWVMRGWLNGFDARIALGPSPFLLAGGVALVIAIGTVAGHAFRVARANPIHALRYE